MKNYIVKLMDGSTLEITQEDFNKLMKSSGLVAIQSTGDVINMSSISRIIPANRAEELEDKKNQNIGILHDGLLIVRHFGCWYVDGEFDDKGNPCKRVDPSYYQEVRQDCVPTRKEYELKYKALPREERLKLILQKATRRDNKLLE